MTTDPRRAYIAIASRQFAENGFHGTSLAAVAKDAGVSKQALLHFFGTKESLYREVLGALCARLCSEIDAASENNPGEHLARYFSQMAEATLAEAEDARLVIRALLDADPRAGHWPLKPYLDRLVALVRAVPQWSDLSVDAALAEAYRFIGAIQYMSISLPTLQGMYGAPARDALARSVQENIARDLSAMGLGIGPQV